ncbi:hypothetical protein FB45DRAFT_782921 [Roridomyces roridus]|uniref:F-box domain-containing protein n=1 Tax=Roridomyces roridus TaxID=1738132 RepID=A0AAD7CGP8_9AGAR|nr:hypothetical protein FB45DRAFT_782921 [Roridomyces roridus]
MHPVLTTAELVELVCEKLNEPDPRPRFVGTSASEGTLASLAVTCRAFREPALDALWKMQRGIQNVIKCLPSHLWELREDALNMDADQEFEWTGENPHRRPLHIIGTIQPGDWAVPLSYSRRIKTLFLCSPLPAEMHVLDTTLFEAIASTLPSPLFCPNLRSLHWGMDDEEDLLPYLNLFLGPRIEFVNFNIGTPTFNDIPIPSGLALQSLKRLHAPCNFKLAGSAAEDAVLLCRPACELIKQLDQIEVLSLPNVNREALERLSRFPSLKALNLAYARPEVLGPASDGGTHPSPGFPALRSVRLEAALPDFILEFLQLQSSDCGIADLYVEFAGGIPQGRNVSVVSDAINARLSSTSLKRLSLSMTVHGRPRPSIHDLGGDINDLIPLFSFHALVKVHLSLPVVAHMDDAMIADVARSWPKLTELELADPDHNICLRPIPRQPPRMTLKALVAFAAHCRDLESLTLYIDAAADIPLASDGEFPKAQLALRTLDVGMSPIGKEFESVAKFLGRLFPRLEKIEPDVRVKIGWDKSVAGRTTEARWKSIQRLLQEGSE